MGNRHARLAILLAALALLAPVAARGGTAERELSRDDVVAALERGPGPTLGAPMARLTIVELADFQCGYCRKFRRETLPRLEERYIRTGKVRFVYRHLAVLGPASVAAAESAVCAHEQGRFWPYHDRLLEQTSPVAFTAARLRGYAQELGLDAKAFGACLESGRPARLVEAETTLGHLLGLSGTPAFLIGGRTLMGAYPTSVFEQVLDAALAGGAPGR